MRPDPLYAGPPLCDRCGQCIEACPTGALKPDQPWQVSVEGKLWEYSIGSFSPGRVSSERSLILISRYPMIVLVAGTLP